ncbi:MAG: deoxyribodipyrimidine photo-lyase, partial [Dokdonia donghaensis]|nr:deoxyribodipyrimidine photo-lyase [Dokdonia donghaensis]
MSTKKVTIFWFRRDLRLDDNVGFLEALKGDYPVLPIFIFDKEILDKLTEDDARVTFIYNELQKMRDTLQAEHDSSLAMFYSTPEQIFKELIADYDVQAVITNRDYEPYALERDKKIASLLEENDISFTTFKDQVIFE